MTAQRVALLEVLDQCGHPCAEEVYQLLRRRLPRVSLATVYRNLELMSRAGLIKRLGTSSEQMRFDCNTGRHYHVRCTGCGRVADLASNGRLVDERGVGRLTDFRITGYSLEFSGLCPACSQGAKQRDAATRQVGKTMTERQQHQEEED